MKFWLRFSLIILVIVTCLGFAVAQNDYIVINTAPNCEEIGTICLGHVHAPTIIHIELGKHLIFGFPSILLLSQSKEYTPSINLMIEQGRYTEAQTKIGELKAYGNR